MTPAPDGPAHLESIRGSPSRSVHFPRVLPLSAVLFPDPGPPWHGYIDTQLAPVSTQVCVSPSEPSRTGQGGQGTGPAGCVVLAHLDLVFGTHAPRDSPSLAHPPEAPASRSLEPPCVALGWDVADLSDLPPVVVVVDTITQAGAPSTRQAYALKWSLFTVHWYSSHREDPRRCTIRAFFPTREVGA